MITEDVPGIMRPLFPPAFVRRPKFNKPIIHKTINADDALDEDPTRWQDEDLITQSVWPSHARLLLS